MKKLLPLLLLVLAGCATTPQSYTFDIKDYSMPLQHYPLKATLYYKPNVKDSQLLEMEFNQYGTKQTGYFRVAYGSIIFKKFNSAFSKMFKEAERSLVAERETRLLEAKNKGSDLLCDVEVVKNSFKWEKDESTMKTMAKIMLNPFPSKIRYSASTDLEMKISFYKPDGSIVCEKTYPCKTTEPVYIGSNDAIKSLLDRSNMQLSNAVDEIIGKAVKDLGDSSRFRELIDSRQQAVSQETL